MAKALGATLYCKRQSKMRMEQEYTAWTGSDVEEDHLIIVGGKILRRVSESMDLDKYKSLALVVCASTCCREAKWWNEYVRQHKILVYAMPDLLPYCDFEVHAKPIYQTVILPKIAPVKRTDKIVIVHSPNGKGKWKGTPLIKKTVRKLLDKYSWLEYVQLDGLPWLECLQQKASADIFIDQVIEGNPKIPQNRFGKKIKYRGGLGKNGLEAMLLGARVIVGAPVPNTGHSFPPPPVCWTDAKAFPKALETCILNAKVGKNIHKKMIGQQWSWANRYTSPGFVAKYITQHITPGVLDVIHNR